MAQYDEDVERFLQQQLQYCKEQDAILAAIEEVLLYMRALAGHRSAHTLPEHEVLHLSKEMHVLEAEFHRLQMSLDHRPIH